MNQALFNFLKPDRLTEVVDIGANPIEGYPPYQKMLGAEVCRVTGFEPQLDALEKLHKSETQYERYLPYTIGTGSRRVLYQCQYSGWTSLFFPDQKALQVFPAFQNNAKVIEHIAVYPQPLDSVSEIQEMDFLKLDVQGAELDCLKSGIGKLRSCVFIQLEISFVTLYEGQPSFGEVDVFLRAQGFMPHCFANIKRWPIDPVIVGGDPTKPLNQLLEADLVYVRNFIEPSSISDEQLKHMALVAHYCYGSFDLAARCIAILTQREVLPNGSAEHYISVLAK